MQTGPRSEKRPPDVIDNAVHVAQIGTGEIRETYSQQPKHRRLSEDHRFVTRQSPDKQELISQGVPN